MGDIKAKDLIKLPFEERDKIYRYPYTGPYSGEPELYEILFLKEYRDIWGHDSLATYHPCPACNSRKAEWVRQEWCICYDCLIAFDGWELYIDLTEDEKPEEEILEEV